MSLKLVLWRPEIMENDQLESFISEFQEWALFDGTYSMSTIKRDTRKIRELSRQFDILHPTVENVRNYFLGKLHEGKVQRSTLNVTRKALMKWFRFLNQRHGVGIDIKIPKQPEKRRAISWIPTNEEVMKIIQMADRQPNKEVAARDGAVMRLLFSGGLRIGEVVKVNLQDVRATGIFVHSEKGGEDGVVGLSDDCISSIQKYMMYRRETDPSALFTSSSGRVSYEYLRPHISSLGKRVAPSWHPHAARHWVATFLLAGDHVNGIEPLDIRYVQTQLRHASLASTQIYTHVNRDELAASVNKRLSKFFRDDGKEVKKVNPHIIIRVWRGSNPRPMD